MKGGKLNMKTSWRKEYDRPILSFLGVWEGRVDSKKNQYFNME